MTPDLWKALIGAIVLVLTAFAAYIKMRTDIDKIRTERADTKQARDKDSETPRERRGAFLLPEFTSYFLLGGFLPPFFVPQAMGTPWLMLL